MKYRPEGCLAGTESNEYYLSSADGLAAAMEKGIILESRVILCNSRHDLKVELPCAEGTIPREEGAVGISDGSTRDIALISRVNKPVCFKVKKLSSEPDGKMHALLSRKEAQLDCIRNYIRTLSPGDIIDASVTHLEQFGAFVDIGCGIPSLIPIDAISVSRISHPSDRFSCGQNIRAIVRSRNNDRIFLTHKELLGTWAENAEFFNAGDTVPGIVRSVEEYGIFVELAPNLVGLAELRDDISNGQHVSVYIKAVIPEKMKIKLIIVDKCGKRDPDHNMRYFIDSDHIDSWMYSTENSGRITETVFG